MKLNQGFFQRTWWIGLLLISGIGIAIDMALTSKGAGASGDSVWYLAGAENLLKGIGYGILRSDGFIPNNMYPPLYSISLASLGLTGLPLLVIARFFNAVLLGFDIFMIGWLAYQLTHSPVASILASAFVLLSFNFLFIHTWAMSEPLYISLSILSFVLIYLFEQKGKPIFLYLAVFLAGLSVITRYIGISLVMAICLWTILFGRTKFGRRILDLTIMVIIGVLPTVIFLAANSTQAHSAVGRTEILFRLIPKENLAQLEKALLGWYSPVAGSVIPHTYLHISFIILLLVSVGPYIFLILPNKRFLEDRIRDLLRNQFLSIFYISLYFITMILSISLSLAGNPTDSSQNQVLRYLVPIYPIFILFMTVMFHVYSWKLTSLRLIKFTPFAVGSLLLVLLLFNFTGQVKIPQSYGYTDIRNSWPALVKQLKSIQPTRPIITNNYELVYFLIDRPVYSIPGKGDELTGKPNPNYPQLMRKIDELIAADGVVVLYGASPEDIIQDQALLANLHVINSYSDVTLYSITGN